MKQGSAIRIAMLGTLSLALAMGIGRFVYTPLLPLMQGDGLLSIEQGGVLASVHFLGYLIGAFYAGQLPFPPRVVLRCALLVIAISTLGMGLTSSFSMWLILRFVAGVTSAWALVFVSNFYIKYLAECGNIQMQSFVFSGVGFGIAIAGLITLVIMIAGVGSAMSWLIFGMISLIMAVAICLMIGSEVPDKAVTGTRRKSQRSPLLWRLIIPYGALGAAYVIPATYLPIMAQEAISSPLIFGWAWPIFGTAAIVSTLMAGHLQKVFSANQIWIGSQIVLAIGLLLPVFFNHIVSIAIAGICVGGTFVVMTMMGLKETHRLAPANDIMRHLAIMTVAFATGQIVGPFFASSIYSFTNDFSIALILASTLLIVTAAILIFNTRSDARQPVSDTKSVTPEKASGNSEDRS